MFVDTSGWGAIVDPTQPFHARALAFAGKGTVAHPSVTTNLVLVELVALLTRPLRIAKAAQIQILRDLRTDPTIEVVYVDPVLEAAAWRLWEARPDKDWSLVDCASFVVMRQRGLTDALTSDHHFEQAGFVRLLK
jgi:predicted nucleic acid-binding protein